mmetsp:Transcript_18126/g.26904  ORF Transcript_18126/g.26904 Transcript_18126/m.26904 type:complete len:213 (-) Transcript_18126:511-1149(-)
MKKSLHCFLLLIVSFHCCKSDDGRDAINHYTTIGMPRVEDPAIMKAVLSSKAVNQKRLSIPDLPNDCSYILCSSRSGAQLWGECQRENMFGGFFPHFQGKSRIPLCILSKEEKFFHFDDGTMSNEALDGSFWALIDYEDHRGSKFVMQESAALGQIALVAMATMVKGEHVMAGLGYYGILCVLPFRLSEFWFCRAQDFSSGTLYAPTNSICA